MLEESLEPSEKTLQETGSALCLMQKMRQKSKGKERKRAKRLLRTKSRKTAKTGIRRRNSKLGKDLEKLEEFEQRQELIEQAEPPSGNRRAKPQIAKEQEN